MKYADTALPARPVTLPDQVRAAFVLAQSGTHAMNPSPLAPLTPDTIRSAVPDDPVWNPGVAVRLPEGSEKNVPHARACKGTVPRLPRFWDALKFNPPASGAELAVALHAYIRPEIRFSGLDALKAQIAEDAAQARALLAAAPPAL